MSYKVVEEDFVVTESEEDARMLGKKQAQSFLLHKGEFICIPHGVHQSDEKYFRDPQRFDARRFWAKDNDEKGEAAEDQADVRVEYGTMKVWGGGKQMCKGKTFAEREVVLFAAAILMQWDISPVSDGGKWVHPGRKAGAGVVVPVREVRVKMSRREG
jgi:cytochrome P450